MMGHQDDNVVKGGILDTTQHPQRVLPLLVEAWAVDQGGAEP